MVIISINISEAGMIQKEFTLITFNAHFSHSAGLI